MLETHDSAAVLGRTSSRCLLLVFIPYGFISLSRSPAMHACHRPPPPTALPLQVLALPPSPPRCWSSRSPDAPRAREGVPAESPSSQHVYHAAAEQKPRSALRFALHSVPQTQKRWVSIYVVKRPNKPGREKYNSSCAGTVLS